MTMKAILGALILRAEGFSKYREFSLLTSLVQELWLLKGSASFR